MALTNKRIAQLAKQERARTLAVENFLMSLTSGLKSAALENLALDARLYGWGAATRDAIETGINEAYS